MREQEKGKKRAILWLLVASLVTFLPFITYPSYDGFGSDALLLYGFTAAKIFGFAGVILFIWQQILGNRFVVKNILKDIAWSTKLHRQVGTYAIVFVLVHPLLMAYVYGWDLLTSLPDLSTDYGVGLAYGRAALVAFLLIWVTSAVLRRRLKYRPWKYLHYLTYVLVPFVFLHANELGSTLSGNQYARLAWYILLSIYIWAVVMRFLHFLGFGQTRYRLITKKEVSQGVFKYVLEPVSKKNISPAAGQFAYLRRGIFSEEHPFTIADYNPKTGDITIISKVFGSFTKKLSQAKVDTKVYIDGPYGYFTTQLSAPRKRPSILIAGGIGITPFMRHIFTAKNRHLFLFNCNQSIKTVLMRPELKEALGKRYVDVISQNSKGQNIETGYISTEIISSYVTKDLKKFDFYICGPPAMMTAISEDLRNNGISAKNIYSEDFSF